MLTLCICGTKICDMKDMNKRHDQDKYAKLREIEYALNLSFSSHMLIGTRLIAVDGIKRKLLVLDIEDATSLPCIIHLDEVKAISVKKNYRAIRPGDLTKRDLEDFLEMIALYFEYRDERKPVSLTFYEHGVGNFNDLAVLERNARTWQMILSKMTVPNSTKLGKEKAEVWASMLAD